MIDHDAAMRIADIVLQERWEDDPRYIVARAYKDVVRERDALREFTEYALGEWSWGWNIPDGGSMQDKAEALGIIVEVPADDAFKADYDADTMFTCAWSDAARAATTKDTKGEQK